MKKYRGVIGKSYLGNEGKGTKNKTVVNEYRTKRGKRSS